MPELRIAARDGRRRLPLTGEVVRLGRAPECDVRLDDPSVSRRHARLVRTAVGYAIRDDGSRNAVTVNGRPVREAVLRHGDEITLGDTTAVYWDPPGTSTLLETLAEAPGERPGGPERSERSEVLARIGALVTADAGTVLDDMLRTVVSTCNVTRAAVVLRSEDRWTPAAVLDTDDPDAATADVRLPRAVLARAADEGRAILASDALHDSRLGDAASVEDLGIVSAMCAPLLVQGRLEGLVYGDTRDAAVDFAEADLELFEVLCGLCGLAVARVRMERELRARERAQAELAAAGRIHARLFPEGAPAVTGFDIRGRSRPSDETGGDFYDWLELPGGRLGLVLADVAGHGVGPALLMSAARAILRLTARDHDSPAKVLRRANDLLLEDFPDDQFVTVFFGLLDPETRRLTWSAGGHSDAFMVRGGDDVRLRATGPPLGVLPGQDYEDDVLDLPPGAVLVLHSDGLVEEKDRRGEMFGRDRAVRLAATLADAGADAVLDGLFEAVDAWSSDGHVRDDLTVVVVRATGS